MKLQRDPNQPGVWLNPQWQIGTAGTFAVIIGVSRYDHLSGDAPSFGMNQLYVSALTAYRFFLWLDGDYQNQGCPLAKCWLLLSPTEGETPLIPLQPGDALAPTMQNCEDAIGKWYLEMEQLGQSDALGSRSFFFFSGHGLEVLEDKQILLPSDYLRPPLRNVNRALSTYNLSRGVKGLKVPHHFFFLDACRNDHNNLGGNEALDGQRVLNEYRASLNNPDCEVPLFYATASGTQAWQPTNPTQGASIFGEALLDGLRAGAGLQPDCRNRPCVVDFPVLTPWMNTRVNDILKNRFNATVPQKVRLRGDHTSRPITEIPSCTPAPSLPPGVPPSSAPAAGIPSRMAMLSQAFDIHVPVSGQPPADENEGHDIFGSENMTEAWLNTLTVTNLGSGEPITRRPAYLLHKVDRTNDTRSFRIEISLPAQGPHWLQLSDGVQSFGCVLPGDKHLKPHYLIEIDFEFRIGERPRHFARLDVSLAVESESLLHHAAVLWEKYDSETAISACNSSDMRKLEMVLGEKLDSPLGAMVAGIVLLRARQWERLHDWLRNLGSWIEWLPDGPVLWTEQSLQMSRSRAATPEMIESFLQLERRGLPFTVDGFGYALRQADIFLDSRELAERTRTRVSRLRDQLRHAGSFFRNGGFFSVFAGPKDKISPRLVRPELNRRAVRGTV
jgi:hypothetical protein